MISLIDTAAWIEFFRAKGDHSQKSKIADLLAAGHAAYTCPIRFELFLGARQSELSDLHEGLGFAQRLILGQRHWDLAAGHGATLRAKGFTVPASDLLIATIAVEEKVSLLSPDAHFCIIQKEALPMLELS